MDAQSLLFERRLTASLLILSFMAFLVVGYLFTARVIWELPTAQTELHLRWERGFVIGAFLINVLGFVLLENLLRNAGDAIFARLAMTISSLVQWSWWSLKQHFSTTTNGSTRSFGSCGAGIPGSGGFWSGIAPHGAGCPLGGLGDDRLEPGLVGHHAYCLSARHLLSLAPLYCSSDHRDRTMEMIRLNVYYDMKGQAVYPLIRLKPTR
ncbi:MAG: hypothetical protein IPL78_02905 [Chloroflexi bacterium]|nr:hypothetical protein [Chloroflexota bacterium]